jgi:carbonic anhydrase
VDGPLFFGAAERFAETILDTQDIKALILHMKSVDFMDLTGAETLLSINAQFKRNGIRLVLAGLLNQPLELLRQAGATEKIGEDNIFDDFREAILSVNQRLLQTTCKDCASVLSPEKVRPSHPPKDCQLRTAMVMNSEKMANIMAERIESPVINRLLEDTELAAIADSRLLPISSVDDIPAQLKGTPVEALLIAQNFYQVMDEADSSANLIIGMCMDYRKQLHLPKNCAYIIRSPGANMKDHEFAIALALSTGIRYMALLVHNNCIMSDPFKRRNDFVKVMVRDHRWRHEHAEVMFDDSVQFSYIGEPIVFALEEAHRLRTLFPKLVVVPLLYDVDSDKVFLVRDNDWIAADAQ